MHPYICIILKHFTSYFIKLFAAKNKIADLIQALNFLQLNPVKKIYNDIRIWQNNVFGSYITVTIVKGGESLISQKVDIFLKYFFSVLVLVHCNTNVFLFLNALCANQSSQQRIII